MLPIWVVAQKKKKKSKIMTRRLLYNLRNSHATQKRDCNKLFENFIYLFNTRFLNQDFDYFEA